MSEKSPFIYGIRLTWNRSGQQLIVHVLNEWADTTAMGVFAVRTGPA